jgi:CubicO group peptidase (beta-lactamase class C family)
VSISIEAAIGSIMNSFKLPSLTIGIVKDGEIVYGKRVWGKKHYSSEIAV